VTHSVFPLTVNELGEVRIAVHPEEADEARRIIDSHRTELTTGQLVRIRDEFEPLQRAIEYRFRDRGLLEHAMTHTSRASPVAIVAKTRLPAGVSAKSGMPSSGNCHSGRTRGGSSVIGPRAYAVI